MSQLIALIAGNCIFIIDVDVHFTSKHSARFYILECVVNLSVNLDFRADSILSTLKVRVHQRVGLNQNLDYYFKFIMNKIAQNLYELRLSQFFEKLTLPDPPVTHHEFADNGYALIFANEISYEDKQQHTENLLNQNICPCSDYLHQLHNFESFDEFGELAKHLDHLVEQRNPKYKFQSLQKHSKCTCKCHIEYAQIRLSNPNRLRRRRKRKTEANKSNKSSTKN